MKKEKTKPMSELIYNLEDVWLEANECCIKLDSYIKDPRHYTFDYLTSLLDSMELTRNYIETISLKVRGEE